MIKIFVAIIVIATGQTELLTSKASYPTIEACEAVREEIVAKTVAEIEAQLGPIKSASICEADGQEVKN